MSGGSGCVGDTAPIPPWGDIPWGGNFAEHAGRKSVNPVFGLPACASIQAAPLQSRSHSGRSILSDSSDYHFQLDGTITPSPVPETDPQPKLPKRAHTAPSRLQTTSVESVVSAAPRKRKAEVLREACDQVVQSATRVAASAKATATEYARNAATQFSYAAQSFWARCTRQRLPAPEP
jgi:hypothetical protein